MDVYSLLQGSINKESVWGSSSGHSKGGQEEFVPFQVASGWHVRTFEPFKLYPSSHENVHDSSVTWNPEVHTTEPCNGSFCSYEHGRAVSKQILNKIKLDVI